MEGGVLGAEHEDAEGERALAGPLLGREDLGAVVLEDVRDREALREDRAREPGARVSPVDEVGREGAQLAQDGAHELSPEHELLAARQAVGEVAGHGDDRRLCPRRRDPRRREQADVDLLLEESVRDARDVRDRAAGVHDRQEVGAQVSDPPRPHSQRHGVRALELGERPPGSEALAETHEGTQEAHVEEPLDDLPESGNQLVDVAEEVSRRILRIELGKHPSRYEGTQTGLRHRAHLVLG